MTLIKKASFGQEKKTPGISRFQHTFFPSAIIVKTSDQQPNLRPIYFTGSPLKFWFVFQEHSVEEQVLSIFVVARKLSHTVVSMSNRVDADISQDAPDLFLQICYMVSSKSFE